MRIVFAGTPDFAAKHLEALINAHFEVVAVYTQPDRPAGRGKKPQASAVKQLAQQHNIRVCQPENFKSAEAITELEAWNADLMVVVAYGIILPKSVLTTPKLGCINVHGSLLPAWRGAAPIQRSIWAGDKTTGVTIMQMDEGLDTGPMLFKAQTEISSDDTSASLYDKLAELGPQALISALNNFTHLKPEPQDDSAASYAKKLSKEEARIDWQLKAEQLARNCRAFNPWPVQWFNVNEQAVKVWACHAIAADSSESTAGQVLRADKTGIEVATKAGSLVLTKLQFPGKKPMSVADVLNGKADLFRIGSQL